jgi:hypothetical protein
MRWFHIRKTGIDRALRETFERYGTVGMQVSLGAAEARLARPANNKTKVSRRGGVIAGSSAGASILASYLVRGEGS